EFSQDVVPDTSAAAIVSGQQKVLFLKLLKATSQRTNLPIWDLMMKNVYGLKTKDGSPVTSVQPGDFKLNVLYEQPSLGQKRYLPEGDRTGIPLITLLNLDRLNTRLDPLPDGVFDYLEGYTVVSSQGRIIFPFLEPFGRDLDSIAFINSTPDVRQKYVYYPLYDTIKEIAKTFANLDRYIISGYAKGQSSSEMSLGAFNVPPGSVTVQAGGQILRENIDYSIDYNLGTVRILNQAILTSGVPVNIQFENNAGFGIQQRNFMGLRLDYNALNTAKKSLGLGATMVRLGERPFFTKTSYNEDPIRNTMYGVDFNYRSESQRLTRMLDKLPFYSTNEMSTITAYGEAAMLKPGHPPQIGKGSSGLIFIDDFEGSRNSIDLRFPLVGWGISSTPQGNGLFPEASMRDTLEYGFNRAKIAWYNIEPVLQDRRNPNNPIDDDLLNDPRVRPVNVTQIYPNRTPDFGQAQLVTFDLAYYPTDRGPYNFDARPGSVDPSGKLLNPQTRWGGIMRGIDQVDFETGNVEFLEFWVQDPFLRAQSPNGGQLYFNLGNISEDVLRDGKRFFENGISGANTRATEDSSGRWGKVPANPIQVTQAFSNDPADRPLQDAGFDGLVNEAERRKFQEYLDMLATNFGVNSPAYQKALADPASDDFKNYRDASFTNRAGILERYKDINNPQGNSPVAGSGDQFVNAFTLYPDQEEFNRDNTLNELEEYFQYRIEMRNGTDPLMQVGNNFITDKREFTPSGGSPERWYLFRVPIAAYESKIGNIPDFKSIRFMRMFLSGFEDSVILRFAKLELVRNTWRRFNYELDTIGTYQLIPANTTTTFNQLAVNIEENSSRNPVVYKTPPGVVRQQQLSNNNVNVLLNEQSLSMQICNLRQRESRGVFKTVNLDLRQYTNLQMYWHAESVQSSTDIKDGEMYAVMRIGNDLINNFYEVRIPLNVTPWGTTDPGAIWPLANELDIVLERLTQLKVSRNTNGNVLDYYREVDAAGKEFSILGNPNLGEVRVVFLGVENRKREDICTEVWVNELRLGGLDEKPGWAATARVDFKLADLGTLYISGSAHSTGFGSLEQRVNERSRDNYTQFDVAANLELGKLLPRRAGMSIPVYASLQRSVSSPEYDPYDLDIKLKDKLSGAASNLRDSIKEDAVDVKTIKTLNFTNVKKLNTSGKKQQLWSIENIDVSYSYYKEEQHNPLIESNELTRHRGGVGYNYTASPKSWEPFKNILRSKSPWFAIIKDFNINPVPSLLGFRADVQRQFGSFRPRNVGGPKGGLPETYDKWFTFDRVYNLRWDLTKSINIDYSAINKAWIDEDTGRLDKIERKRVWDNLWKGGRTIAFDQTAGISYTLPINKIPILDWTSVRVSYNSTFNWLAASLIARNLGNSMANTQQKNLTSELDFTRLYSKSRFLRALEDDSPPPPAATPDSTSRSDTASKKKRRDRTQPLVLSPAVKFAGRFLTAMKRINVTYAENASTTIYGYTDSTRNLGMNFKSNAPGLGFVFGQQPDTSYINRLADRGLITADPNFNFLNRQDYSQKLSVTAQLIPIRDFNIDINLEKSFGKTYSELYKDTVGFSGNFNRLSPYAGGSFSVTWISYKTLFEKIPLNEVSNTFRTFESNRLVIAQRLARLNRYSQDANGNPIPTGDGYYKGYTKYAQDVILPAFIAAYTGRDPNTVPLVEQSNPRTRSNPFKGYLPRPNWRITYNGLTRIKALEKIFTSFTLSHAYNSTLSMNSYNSSLLFEDPLRIGYPSFIDTLTGNYVPFFLVPNMTISERFEPFIDVDMTFTNQVTARFEFKKSRTLSLSLIDFQLSENRSTEFVFGGGWRKRGIFSFLKWKGKPLDNDAAFRLDFSVRDDATANSRLDQTTSLPTAGQKVVFINPSIDYVISNRVSLKFYFEQRRVEPKISTAPPITNTRAGVQVRVSLAQ
ncbi:MAG: cell surface protein SprA, partial [Chitinophagaceae bacterium]|nr:cell surface protein SprA [Chitinophagaceae bacterium]